MRRLPKKGLNVNIAQYREQVICTISIASCLHIDTLSLPRVYIVDISNISSQCRVRSYLPCRAVLSARIYVRMPRIKYTPRKDGTTHDIPTYANNRSTPANVVLDNEELALFQSTTECYDRAIASYYLSSFSDISSAICAYEDDKDCDIKSKNNINYDTPASPKNQALNI